MSDEQTRLLQQILECLQEQTTLYRTAQETHISMQKRHISMQEKSYWLVLWSFGLLAIAIVIAAAIW
jgi:hypothetical protein